MQSQFLHIYIPRGNIQRDYAHILIHDSFNENKISRSNLIKVVNDLYNDNFKTPKKDKESRK